MSAGRLSRAIELRAARLWTVLAVGTAIAAIQVAVAPDRGWPGLLTAAVFGTHLALGGGVFLAILAAAGGRWWRPLWRLPLLLMRTLPIPLAVLALCLTLGMEALYPWARAAAAASPVLKAKEVWLNPPFFLARALVIATVWILALSALAARVRDWAARGESAARPMGRAAAAFLVLLAPTLSVASWDWTMSLEPEWFSTMYGVYAFAGTFLGGIALLTVPVVVLSGRGLLGERVDDAQRHDVGKLLFAFATFWAYIWFCQYLLIWYANLPEETVHYEARLGGGWSMLFYLNPVLNFVVPFVALLSERAKRHGPTLVQVALVVLAGRWLDSYLLVAPAFGPAPGVPVGAVAASLAVVAGMALGVRYGRRAVQWPGAEPPAPLQLGMEAAARRPAR